MPAISASQPSALEPALAGRIPAIEYHDSEYGGGQVQMTTTWFMAQLQWLSDNGFKTLTNAEMIAFATGQQRPQQRSCFLRFCTGLDEVFSCADRKLARQLFRLERRQFRLGRRSD